MKKLLFLLSLLISFSSLCQNNSIKKLNGFKYAILESDDYQIKDALETVGIVAYFKNDSLPDIVRKNICQTVNVSSKNYSKNSFTTFKPFFTDILFMDCLGNTFLVITKNDYTYNKALKKALKKLNSLKYSYDPSKTPKRIPRIPDAVIPIDSEHPSSKIDYYSEESVRNYFDENGIDLIEGIWEFAPDGINDYRLAIIKDDYKFIAKIIEGPRLWKPGDVKASLETAATDEILTIKWTMADRTTISKGIGTNKNNLLIEFSLPNTTNKAILYKIYPKSGSKLKTKSGDWAASGSGIIISKSGYIVTNHHVIENADDIEVEFILNEEVQMFNAEIVQVDETNDLAIIKIVDINFDGVDEPPYNFKTRSSDVGTKVYAFGFPFISYMGKEIKVTDGMISAKTGFDGNITTYQITAPIQPGNSGGPLFDENGNFIGINSSGLNKEITDNVGYTIKSNYILNLIDVMPKNIDLPSNTKLQSLSLPEQIKEIKKYVVLIKIK